MRSFSRRLFSFFAGIAGIGLCTIALTAVVEYKPWGVPDSRRQDYDRLVAGLDERNALHTHYEHRARPIVKVQQPTLDFGLQHPGSTLSHRFEIRNDGLETLTLSLASSLPDCDVSPATTSVAPGESTDLQVTCKIPEEPIAFDRTVTLHTNDPLEDEILLTVIGKVKARMVVPHSLDLAAADPAQPTDNSFLVYSQVWKEFEITQIESDLPIFAWHAEPVSITESELDQTHATSAWRVRMQTTMMDYGHYTGRLDLSIRTNDGVTHQHSIALAGRVRPPIIFHSRELHVTDGLDMGTMFSGKPHQAHILVRLRGDLNRPIEVLDIRPTELKGELQYLGTPGNYRLTLSISPDCPMVVFNRGDQHGYVSIGDPNDEQFKNWFPIHGAVVPPPR